MLLTLLSGGGAGGYLYIPGQPEARKILSQKQKNKLNEKCISYFPVSLPYGLKATYFNFVNYLCMC